MRSMNHIKIFPLPVAQIVARQEIIKEHQYSQHQRGIKGFVDALSSNLYTR